MKTRIRWKFDKEKSKGIKNKDVRAIRQPIFQL